MVIFSSRQEAGMILGRQMLSLRLKLNQPITLGIARGGLPVGYGVSMALGSQLDVLVLRKLPIPGNPEAGFGAVCPDKTVILNQMLLDALGLSEQQIEGIIDEVYQEVLRRNQAYRGNNEFPSLAHRSVILVDDGLASGYTMLAAIKFARQKNAGSVIVAIPVAHRQAYELVSRQADRVICHHISDQTYFAVASFYGAFPEMDDAEVLAYLSWGLRKG